MALTLQALSESPDLSGLQLLDSVLQDPYLRFWFPIPREIADAPCAVGPAVGTDRDQATRAVLAGECPAVFTFVVRLRVLLIVIGCGCWLIAILAAGTSAVLFYVRLLRRD